MSFFTDETKNDIHEMNENDKKIYRMGIFRGSLYTLWLVLTVLLLFNVYRIKHRDIGNYVDKAREIYDILDKKYVDKIDDEELFDGIYMGMVANTTDRYSGYFNKKAFEDFTVSTEGNYGGIGVSISLNENSDIVFVNIYENSPADKAGIIPGDRLLKVDGKMVNEDNYKEITEMVRGEAGTNVVLTVLKKADSSTADFTLTREIVDIPTVASAMLTGSGNESIGYIHISGFDGVTSGQFEEAYNSLLNQNMQGLIIDLRDNPGGLLTCVTEIADILLPKGIITYTEDKYGFKDYIYADTGEIEIPLVILVNEKSASASELLSAAVKDMEKGVIVGTNTYGKGVVQTTFPFTDGSAVKVTTAKYYTPNGVCIDGVGVKPDVEIQLNPDYILPMIANKEASYNTELDNQLAEGIKQIENRLN